ncbi:hypothetical protein A3H80_01410 [Candidatus Roizmanbacteria bacterium RIFCSPLOWO2_02_FULL_37_19]|uniref:Cohesin domain-containing protein n=1 Tax=Candidatus Roizmanbacteria bacterium RIFCSPHIGHO2_02_FULL_37_24 TaxID=1802037 RepID=A0A1F7GW72_9BACT|nr:MAG: hypothetical protein A2862_01430 [Candidatus Roizmanbacteria bacterium RIFCSPHIGHO2_01_FULL_38_41]OGK23004.1 MAG: hypothetical protein A3C24_02595 [Candidatus Roizmanbacteria bacterium RIFCSPHIGHO2_02_FULL_37_24]OGK32770.1 MAG: hypothetical protein A3E10_01240 [Candidatus Roizmanbacteria bacterium RIFCSPHIGHO2_12_FULL_37_23]OGK53848.1 MAG: hypothetical protein A3H80_01410 [Candidatus Roizmanbacteria bacterium RIFCSPLOWO2_02_FULL_37_19]OGK60190.1 MAG: hypothetical protein A3G65_01895 [Ca
MTLSKFSLSILASMIVLFIIPLFSSAFAATLQFNPSSLSKKTGDTFELEVIVDAGDKQVLSVDALINFDGNVLQVESITNGTYLDIGQKDFKNTGKAYIAGVVAGPGVTVTGKGTLAKILFKAKAKGRTNITFICEMGEKTESNISEASIDATDLIECSQNGQAVVVVDGGDTDRTSTSSGRTGGGTGELPQTGILDNLVILSIIGGILFIVGVGAKMLL